MGRKNKGPGTGAPRDVERGGRGPGGQTPPREVETRRPDEPAKRWRPEQPRERATERSEDFGGRRDIETADEPAEEHDRRHHGRGGSDVDSSQPA